MGRSNQAVGCQPGQFPKRSDLPAWCLRVSTSRSLGGLLYPATPTRGAMPLALSHVEVFPAREDNFGYLVHEEASGLTVAVDAPSADMINQVLERRGWSLTHLLITHHHVDHVEGIEALKGRWSVRATGPELEKDKIAGLDDLVSGGDTVRIGAMEFVVIDTPGHTLGHVAYFQPEELRLFAGDSLFSIGCGRMLEGNPQNMWEGLKRLRDLPDEVLLYPGHEYTLSNIRFAETIDPENQSLALARDEALARVGAGDPSIPTLLGREKAANVFLRADDPVLAARMGLSGRPASEVFAAIRRAKDVFK